MEQAVKPQRRLRTAFETHVIEIQVGTPQIINVYGDRFWCASDGGKNDLAWWSRWIVLCPQAMTGRRCLTVVRVR